MASLQESYTKTPNDVLEKTMKTRFSGTQKDIVLAIWRYTYGFGKKESGFSVDFLAEATGIDAKLVKDNIKSLVLRNIILVVQESVGTRPRVLTCNENLEQWDSVIEGVKLPPLSNRRKPTINTENTPTSIPKLPPLEGVKLPPNKEKRKSLKKTIKEGVILPNIPYQEILDYLNQKAGKRFTVKSKPTIEFINGRFKEGRTLEDFKYVIDVKTAQWLDDPKMNEFLRPQTLFCATNFESYLNQKMPVKQLSKFDSDKEDLKRMYEEAENEENGDRSALRLN